MVCIIWKLRVISCCVYEHAVCMDVKSYGEVNQDFLQCLPSNIQDCMFVIRMQMKTLPSLFIVRAVPVIMFRCLKECHWMQIMLSTSIAEHVMAKFAAGDKCTTGLYKWITLTLSPYTTILMVAILGPMLED